ncbi:hypothetical protein NEOC95_000900 [Neochlamydia sp. AcF95]|nr:hypothetical protein [Neochlamydia sp. AcF95]
MARYRFKRSFGKFLLLESSQLASKAFHQNFGYEEA